jgi:hypothetical protein
MLKHLLPICMEMVELSLNNMKSIGPLYGDVIQYYHRNLLPVVEKGWTQETEPSPSVALKCPVVLVSLQLYQEE